MLINYESTISDKDTFAGKANIVQNTLKEIHVETQKISSTTNGICLC